MAVSSPPATMSDTVLSPLCSNPECDKREQKKGAKVLFRMILEGKATMFIKCPRCGHYNVRQFVDGIEIK